MTGTPEIEGRVIVVDRLGAEGKCRPREVRECQSSPVAVCRQMHDWSPVICCLSTCETAL